MEINVDFVKKKMEAKSPLNSSLRQTRPPPPTVLHIKQNHSKNHVSPPPGPILARHHHQQTKHHPLPSRPSTSTQKNQKIHTRQHLSTIHKACYNKPFIPTPKGLYYPTHPNKSPIPCLPSWIPCLISGHRPPGGRYPRLEDRWDF